MIIIVLILFLLSGAAASVRMLLGTKPALGKWGINLKPVSCPCCHTPAPRVRMPANQRQLLWGGWTCSRCDTEFDKYGTPSANSRSQLNP